MLDQVWFDQLSLGRGALAQDCYLDSLNEEHARLNENVLWRARSKILGVESSKFGRRLTCRIAKFSTQTAIVTDDEITPNWQTRLKHAKDETRVGTQSAPTLKGIGT